MTQCWFGIGIEGQRDRCQNEATRRYTLRLLKEEPLISRKAVWCNEHDPGGTEDIPEVTA